MLWDSSHVQDRCDDGEPELLGFDQLTARTREAALGVQAVRQTDIYPHESH